MFTDINPWVRGSTYAREGAALLDLTNLSLTTIQACVLLGVSSRAEGEGGAESVYYSVAYRIANLLDLAKRPADDHIAREVNLRGTIKMSTTDHRR